jgi:phospholipid/cholesterol/gamma-HCH transport system substrate-binding protein
MRKEWAGRELSMEMIVGAFMVMVFLGLGYFTIILSREAWLTKKYPIETVFKNVMGLREGDRVVVRGMPIGKVKSLRLARDGVHVEAMLDNPLRMKKDYKIMIVSTSILGGRYLQIDAGSDEEHEVPLETLFQGQTPHDLMADAADLVNGIRQGLIEGGVIEDLKASVRQIREIVTRVNEGKGMLGKLMSEDETLYNDLSASASSLKALTARLEGGEGTLGKLMSKDDTLYKDLSETAASLKTVAARLENGEGMLGKLMSKDDSLYTNLLATAESLRNITGKIERGEGFLGRMVQDDTLYKNIEAIVGEARATLDDFRETTPITTFTSIFFGAF